MMPMRLAEKREDVRLTFPGNKIISGPRGSALEDYVNYWISIREDKETTITAALLDDSIRELSFVPTSDGDVTPLDLTSLDGMRTYKRSLSMVLVVAVHKALPGTQVNIDHSITASGFYCTLRDQSHITAEELARIETEMKRLVKADLPIERKHMPVNEAAARFSAQGDQDKVRLLRFHSGPTTEVYELEGVIDSFYGLLVPRTGYLQRFQLHIAEDGFMLLFPLREDPNNFPADTNFPKLTSQFRQSVRWLRMVGAEDVGSLNAAIQAGKLRELVLIAEALHERRVSEIATQIAQREGVRIVFIAGPTSSGKTTFAKRLGIQLAASGVHSFAVGLDDYFVDRDMTPRDESGEYDYETFEAVDQALFNDHMLRLLEGGSVTLPRYDFLSGKRVPGEDVSLPKGTVLIVEGLHGLNPQLIPSAPPEALYRIYASSLSQLNIDHHNYIPTSDARLLRRIVRDAYTRGHNAEATIMRWQSVRSGERRWVFPYQEEADAMFNSALPYEMAVLKPLAVPLLLPFDHGSPASIEVQRLLSLLALFLPAEKSVVPDNSLLREFIGGSIMEHVTLAGGTRA